MTLRLSFVRALALVGVIACAPACDGELRLNDDGQSLDHDGAIDGDASSDVTHEEDAREETHHDEDATRDTSGCTRDDDCGLLSLHCDIPTGMCVPCLSDAQCMSGDRRRCDPTLHRCVECSTASDCGGDRACEPTTHRCLDRCGDGAACSGDERCDETRGLCLHCTLDAQCTNVAEPMCDPASGLCVQCRGSADCKDPLRAHCDPSTARCVQCLSSSDCPAFAPYCDPYDGQCTDH